MQTYTKDELQAKFNYDTLSPSLKQYLDLKLGHQDCLLMFRIGDFYELFFDDAKIAAKELQIVLTQRSGADACGIPYRSLYAHAPKLIESGYKLALAEQDLSVTQDKDKLLPRKVTRIITQGTIFEEELLVGHEPNYLCALYIGKSKMSMAYIDLSTLAFYAFDAPPEDLGFYLAK